MNDVLFSTTASIEGYSITKHIGVITEHVVIGADILANFFASFTDLVGGRSNSLENRISALKNDLFRDMERSAKANHANAMVGLHIDFDEISGKNMQLFMVTGTATAVVVKANQDAAALRNSGKIAGYSLQRELTLATLETSISAFKLSLIKPGAILKPEQLIEIIASALKFDAFEIAAQIIELCILIPVGFNIAELSSKALHDISALMLDRPSQQAYNSVLVALMAAREAVGNKLDVTFFGNNGEEVVTGLKKFVATLTVDYLALNHIASSMPCYYWGMFVLPIIYKYKEIYTAGDTEQINRLAATLFDLMSNPTQKCDTEKADGILGKETWTCICGTTLSTKKDLCTNCSRDNYGLNDASRTAIIDAIEHLKRLSTSLDGMFNQPHQ